MPHRGRLNLLTEMLGYPAETMFHKVTCVCVCVCGYMCVSVCVCGSDGNLSWVQIQGKLEYPEGLPTTGDDLSHLGMFGYLGWIFLNVCYL